MGLRQFNTKIEYEDPVADGSVYHCSNAVPAASSGCRGILSPPLSVEAGSHDLPRGALGTSLLPTFNSRSRMILRDDGDYVSCLM